jgi:predicted site-specific integrase-resolvase
LLTVGQAARIASVPVGTIYDWSSAGRLARCARRRGKRLLIVRDRFIEELFNGKEW